MMNPQEFFKKNNYLVIRNFINQDVATLLYFYCKTKAQAVDIKLLYDKEKHSTDWDGNFNDSQVNGGAFYSYGDPIMDSLLVLSKNQIEAYTGLNLLPNYSYWRLYQRGNVLSPHKDRESCEVSITLFLGYDTSNVDAKKYENYNWSMWVKNDNAEEGAPVNMLPGDMIIYRGCDLEHWREKFLGLNHAQVFLHYNDNTGPYQIQYDGRPFIGIPKKFSGG